MRFLGYLPARSAAEDPTSLGPVVRWLCAQQPARRCDDTDEPSRAALVALTPTEVDDEAV